MTDLLLPALPPAHVAPVDPRETLLPMLEGLSRALGYRRALVALHDPRRDVLRGVVGLNVPDPIAEALEVPLSEKGNPLVVALREGRPVRVGAAELEQRLDEHTYALLVEMEIGSFVVAPLRNPPGDGGRPAAGGQLPAVGVVLLSKDEEITDADIERLMPFATQAGTALAQASDAERLRSSEEKFAVEDEWLWLMLNGVGDPVVLTDEKNDIVLLNVRAEALFRSRTDDSPGKARAHMMNNVLFTAGLSTITLDQRARQEGRDLTLVDPIEGTELLFEVISYPVTNYRSSTRGTVSVLKNVTDLRRATEELSQNVQLLQSADEQIRRERDRLNLLLRSVPNPIVVMDTVNQTITMNQEALRLFEAPAGATGRRAQICLSNDAKFTAFVSQLRLDTAQARQGELALTDPDTEETMNMFVSSTEIRDELGAAVATMSVLQDVSRLRELERRRVEQLLFESEKLAATGRLAASIAHEINNPLEAIKNALYLLSAKLSEDAPDRRFLDIATKETERVSRILRQMLGFYRQTKMEPTDINRVIEEAEALVEKHLRLHRVKIENHLDPELPKAVASADQLKQVLLNLLLNAQEAMPQGGTVFVTTHASHGADPEFLMEESIHIQIRDTGAGIPEEALPHIFEPFFSTKEEKGTGLGLWVSHGIVQSHGGNVRVRSRPGRGTTFHISLPIGGPKPDAAADG